LPVEIDCRATAGAKTARLMFPGCFFAYLSGISGAGSSCGYFGGLPRRLGGVGAAGWSATSRSSRRIGARPGVNRGCSSTSCAR